MYHFSNDGFGIVIPMMIFLIPIIAIVGGITAGIVRTISRHRLVELAQRERIAMIEHGMDPMKLPPLPPATDDFGVPIWSPADYVQRRSQGLLIAGLITLAAGISLGVFLYFVTEAEPGVWAVSLIPGAIGLALLISAALVRPKNGGQ